MRGSLTIYEDPAALARGAAERFAELAEDAVRQRGRFAVALSGGRTPVDLYLTLAGPPFADRLPWENIHLFWSDERCVPWTSPQSNYGLVRETLLVGDRVPASNIHPVRTDLDPEAAAEAATHELRAILGDDPLDLVLLGMGADGHVASVFPGTQAAYQKDRGVVALFVQSLDAWRITLTLGEINAAQGVMILVSGAEKATTLADVATGASGLPAERLAPVSGQLMWLVDRAAAGESLTVRAKRAAARAAADEVQDGMHVGLGTGSTADLVLQELANRLRWGDLRDVVGVPTSEATESRARELEIPLTSLNEQSTLDLAIDGADQVDAELRLIKGGGGALLREKMVAACAREFVVVVDESKLVQTLGIGFALPIEVIEYGWRSHLDWLSALGARAALRERDSEPFRSDNGNLVLDAAFDAGIADPAALERALQSRPGIVESGLFLDMADRVYVGSRTGVRLLGDPPPAAKGRHL